MAMLNTFFFRRSVNITAATAVAAMILLTTQNNANAGLPADLVPAVDKIYNAEFAAANRLVSSYIVSHSKDPEGFLLRGMMNEWDQAVNNKRRALNGIIESDYEKANKLAQEAWEADRDDPDRMVLLGNTYMYIAKKLVDKGQKARGGFALKRAKELMLDAIALDADNEDAYMALGVFNYFSANVPSGFKWLATLLGFKGTKAQGIEYLRRAAENDGLNRGDAGYLLVYIYEDKEKNFATAATYNDMLKRRYPGNPMFQFASGELIHRQKKYAEARAEFDRFRSFCASRTKGFCNDKYLFLSHYFTAGGYIEEKKYGEAKKPLDMAVKLNDGQYKDRNVDLDLWAGIIAKSRGDTTAAEGFFRKVEAGKNDNPHAWEIALKEMAPAGT